MPASVGQGRSLAVAAEMRDDTRGGSGSRLFRRKEPTRFDGPRLRFRVNYSSPRLAVSDRAATGNMHIAQSDAPAIDANLNRRVLCTSSHLDIRHPCGMLRDAVGPSKLAGRSTGG